MEKRLFGTDGIRGVANKYPITPEMALKLGKAVAMVFSKAKQKKPNKANNRAKILIGKDTRISGYILETALTSGICSMGVDVLLVGPIPTPAISYLTRELKANAGIVISASHNPAEDNGIKFFSEEGIKIKDKIELEIERLLFSDDLEGVSAKELGKAYRIDDARARYIKLAKGSISNKLYGLKIVLDCANGSAYAVAPTIFKELGADAIVLNDKPNGLNINLNCGALYANNLSTAVKKHKADLGIGLDGDADRVVMCDENGKLIDGDDILAICAIDMKNNGKLKENTIVATVMSNLGIEEELKMHGIKLIRTKVGDRYVIDTILEKSLNLGGEQAGHIIFADYNPTGDGIIASLQVLSIMKKTNKKLSELYSFKKYPQVLVNVKVREKRDFEKMPKVYKMIKNAEKRLNNNGRVFVRYSGTEDLARVMVEGKHQKEIAEIANIIATEIKAVLG